MKAFIQKNSIGNLRLASASVSSEEPTSAKCLIISPSWNLICGRFQADFSVEMQVKRWIFNGADVGDHVASAGMVIDSIPDVVALAPIIQIALSR